MPIATDAYTRLILTLLLRAIQNNTRYYCHLQEIQRRTLPLPYHRYLRLVLCTLIVHPPLLLPKWCYQLQHHGDGCDTTDTIIIIIDCIVTMTITAVLNYAQVRLQWWRTWTSHQRANTTIMHQFEPKDEEDLLSSSRGVEDAANTRKMTILSWGQFESMVTSEIYAVVI